MEQIKITFVGSGDYCNHGGRAQQAILFEQNGHGLMIDFGANTCAQLKHLNIDYCRFQTILLTHYHGDHCGGLPYMIAELNNNPQLIKDPITIIGPKDTETVINNLCSAMSYGQASPDVFHFSDFPETGLKNEWFSISALPMVHRPESLGYKISFGSLKIAVTGDTKWTDQIIDLAKGCDLLICDCNQETGFNKVHISLEELLSHREEIACSNILPVHIDDLGKANPFLDVKDGSVFVLDSNGLRAA